MGMTHWTREIVDLRGTPIPVRVYCGAQLWAERFIGFVDDATVMAAARDALEAAAGCPETGVLCCDRRRCTLYAFRDAAALWRVKAMVDGAVALARASYDYPRWRIGTDWAVAPGSTMKQAWTADGMTLEAKCVLRDGGK